MKPGPYPLTLKHHSSPAHASGRYVITTNQGNHWITTYDPDAARLSLAAPDMLKALEECITDQNATVMSCESFDYFRKRLNAITKVAKAAIAKAKTYPEPDPED